MVLTGQTVGKPWTNVGKRSFCSSPRITSILSLFLMAAPLPTNDALSAMNQATATAGLYLVDAIKVIDAQFGEGYAKQHPELIAGFMQTAASDYRAWSNGVNTAHITQALEYLAHCSDRSMG